MLVIARVAQHLCECGSACLTFFLASAHSVTCAGLLALKVPGILKSSSSSLLCLFSTLLKLSQQCPVVPHLAFKAHVHTSSRSQDLCTSNDKFLSWSPASCDLLTFCYPNNHNRWTAHRLNPVMCTFQWFFIITEIARSSWKCKASVCITWGTEQESGYWVALEWH